MRFIRAVSVLLVLVLVSILLGCEAKAASRHTSITATVVHVDHDVVGQVRAPQTEVSTVTIPSALYSKLPVTATGRPAPETVARE